MDSMVSGGIVTYNNLSTIKKTLSTVFEFTKDVDFKLYVFDNCSTDGTREFIRDNYPQIELIESDENIGFGAGHNAIIKRINSKYHAVINPDIELRSNTIAKMAAYMDKHENIGLLSPRICFPDGRDQILGKKNPHLKYLIASRLRGDEPSRLLRDYAMLDCDLSFPTEIDNATGCFMMFRTETLKKVGGFDERYFMYFEDADITRQIKQIAKVIYYPDAVVYHVWGRDSKRNLKLMAIHLQSMLKYYIKWKMI